MPLPALAIAAIASSAVSIGTGIANVAVSAKKTKSEEELEGRISEYEKEIAAAKARMAKAPGFTQAELEFMSSMGAAASNAAERESMARESELSALYGLEGGQLQQQRLASEELQREQDAQLQQELRAQELAERERNRQELEAMRMSLEGMQMNLAGMQDARRQATSQAAMGLAQSAASAAGTTGDIYTGQQQAGLQKTLQARDLAEEQLRRQRELEAYMRARGGN